MRTELIHPMLVHFPIALLSVGVVLRIAAAWGRKKTHLRFLLPAAWVVLGLGVLGAWAAVIAGEVASDIVGPSLKNISMLEEHAEHAFITAIGFSLGLLLDGTRAFLRTKWRLWHWLVARGLTLAVWFLYLFCLVNLIITGFYGGTLVYEEGAAVKVTQG